MAKRTTKKAKSLSAWFRRTGAYKWSTRNRFNERYFEPYTKSIGQLLLAWNDLHEQFSKLFVLCMGGGFIYRPLAVWHKTRMDLAKRELLKVAISDLSEKEMAGRTKLVKEVLWILDKAKELEGLRDDSAHGPLHASPPSIFEFDNVLLSRNIIEIVTPRVSPNTVFQNPRALRLDKSEADLLRDFRYAKERILILRDYTMAIDLAWTNGRFPWPDRPELPDRNSIRTYKGSAKRQKRK
jgi:hypothetical protein